MEDKFKEYLQKLAKEKFVKDGVYFAIVKKFRYFQRGFHHWRVEPNTLFIVRSYAVETPDGRLIDLDDYKKAEKDGFIARIPDSDWK